MRENEIIAGNYQILHQIGKGGTGKVFLGWHLHLQKYVVLKETQLPTGDETLIRTETDILKNLHHQYLPQVYDFLIDGPQVITVLDYVEGNDLSRFPCGSANLSEEMILKWLGQMAEVLAYLHGNTDPVIHSDIKPGNVIIRPNGDICLIDFNISLMLGGSSKVLGYSAQFASPEQYYLAEKSARGEEPGYSLDPSTDIYSTGALFYYLMTGLAPNSAAPTIPLGEMGEIGYSSGLTNIVDRCMSWEREKRYLNGAELEKAVRYYWKQDDRYKRMLVVKALCILLGAGILSAGLYGVLRWRENKVREAYRNEYAAVADKLREGDDPGAEKAGLEILGNSRYADYLKKSPEDYADLLHALGDIGYNSGDYEQAAGYYEQALSAVKGTDADPSVFYRDYAIALAREDRTADARAVLAQARGAGVSDPVLRMIEISCAYTEGDYTACISLAEEMENDPSADADNVCKAQSYAGMACSRLGDLDGRVSWLTRAAESGNLTYRKMLADAYWELAGDRSIMDSQQKLYAMEARRIYEEICSEYYQTYENLLNLGIIQFYLKDYAASRETLDLCIAKYPGKYEDDHHLSMYKAFLYEETGRMDDARREAGKALEIIDRTGGGANGGQETEALYRLHALSK